MCLGFIVVEVGDGVCAHTCSESNIDLRNLLICQGSDIEWQTMPVFVQKKKRQCYTVLAGRGCPVTIPAQCWYSSIRSERHRQFLRLFHAE